VQFLPGQSFIGSSQRSVVTYGFFGAGSLVVRWTSLLFVPDIFGGNGSAGQPGYFAHYNLAEVTGYVGVLALMATFAFFTRVSKRGWKGAERDYVLYVVLLIVGLFATWGSYTPLGHLFRHIPLYGNTRLQSRNVIVVDFAMTILLGWWFNKIEHRKTRRGRRRRRAKWVTMAPALAIVAFCASLLLLGSPDRLVPRRLPRAGGPGERHAPLLRSAPRDRAGRRPRHRGVAPASEPVADPLRRAVRRRRRLPRPRGVGGHWRQWSDDAVAGVRLVDTGHRAGAPRWSTRAGCTPSPTRCSACPT
jgi:hypothetical protein